MKLIKYIAPPKSWLSPVIILLGIFVGLGGFVFYISNAPSYLSDKPETCVNCHVMAPQYATWMHSSHRENATCNDCHVPQDNFFNTYYFKAKDGMRHASVFTMRNEPQVIFIKKEGAEVVQQNCIRCHTDLVYDAKIASVSKEFNHFRTDRSCVDCHRTVPHGRVNSLSSTPNARVPVPTSVIPKWIFNKENKPKN